MTGTNIARATIDGGYEDGMGDFIASTLDYSKGGQNAKTKHRMEMKMQPDGRMDITVEGMDDQTLAKILTNLGLRLTQTSTPEESTQPQMPTPTLSENTELVPTLKIGWNIVECLNWVEAVVASATDKRQAYKNAVKELVGNIKSQVSAKYQQHTPEDQLQSSFHTAFAQEISRRGGDEAWKHKHGIELPAYPHQEAPQQRQLDHGDRLAAKFLGQ